MNAQRYPLYWPPGRPRTVRRDKPRFTARSLHSVRQALENELRLLGARSVILSTNVELRNDGLPYSGRRAPDDPGVAVYFTRKGRDLCITCDRWGSVEENVRAIADAVEAIRLIERRGTGDMVDAAFEGFSQLPAARVAVRKWWDVFGCQSHTPTEEVRERFRNLVLKHHPDRGGTGEEMVEINAAWKEFRRERAL